ncbi:MAG TPA: hydroxymethylbilane synthase [Verrucomicrobiae bacterium]|nr:hydroxymethylbilane synthase [Verrucomicrobiae bacterium]
MKPLVIGTRGSPLALAQVEIIRGLLRKTNPSLPVETRIIKTSGDNFVNLSLVAGGGKGLFTKEIEDQLLADEIRVAVHSMKDLPTILPDGLMIGAVPPREDVHDVFISKRVQSIGELTNSARVATSSIRRRAQLLAKRPDLQIEEIRGNVETRLRKLAENDALDALILAAAGLRRLGLWKKFGNFYWREIDFDVMIPAVGQGAIACEIRAADAETRAVLAAIDDANTAACVTAERAFLRALGGGCQVPYAAHATVNGKELHLIGATFSPEGKDVRRVDVVGPANDPADVGERAAKQVRR